MDEISDFLQRVDINISIDIVAIETSMAIKTNLTIPLQRGIIEILFLTGSIWEVVTVRGIDLFKTYFAPTSKGIL